MNRTADFIRGNALPLVLLVFASLAVFAPSMGHDFLVNWDDPGYVTKNEAIRSINWVNLKAVFSRFYVGNYAPLQMVSYMVDYALWGLKPAGFIFANIFCHTAAGVLFYALLRRFSFTVGGALFAALLFLLHPVQVESVAWIAQRKNVLAMVFYLLSFHFYLSWFRREGRGGSAYLFSLAAFAAALLVKSVVVILPLILLLHDNCFSVERRQGKFLADKLPYLLAALAIGYLALLSQSTEYDGGGRTGFHGGSLGATVFTMLPVYATYVRMIVWPSGLSVVYAPQIRTGVDPAVISAALALVLLTAGAVRLYRYNRGLFFWAAAIPVGLLPVSQFIPLVTLMNDRYLYFPMLGVAACCGYLLERILARAAAGTRPLVVAVCALLLATCGFLSLQRSRVWQNSSILWKDATTKQPASAVGWYMFGEVQEKRGGFADAIVAEERAREVCRGVECRLVLRKLGELYLRTNMPEKAGQRIAELLRLYPEAADGYTLSGHLSYQGGDLVRAEKAYLKALQVDPGMVSALSALGNVYLATGRPELAMKQYEAVLHAGKPSAELAYSMACAAALMGNRRVALERLDEALRLGYNNPDLIVQNPELDVIKGDKEFIGLMQRYFPGR
ncbi:MAG TPA: tetratricopeptide repeat protein [Geobacteraceae bacterium]|nr:tetratricopeptide repeat protein [Geobacteraceae bacterium]